MQRGVTMLRLAVLAVLLAGVLARSLEVEILTTWDGRPVEHLPVAVSMVRFGPHTLRVAVEAPYFADPAPPTAHNTSYIGLWNYEVVELFFCNDAGQYLQVQVTPRGQYFVLLFAGERNTARYSLPLSVEAGIVGGLAPSWSAVVSIPTSYLPKAVTKFNAYATHGQAPHRHYEAFFPAPSTAPGPDYHALQYFAPIDLDTLFPGLSRLPLPSVLWQDALSGRMRHSILTSWNGSPITHRPITILMEGSPEELRVTIEAPFFGDPAPPGPARQPFFGLWHYEVVSLFFVNKDNQYLEVEIGPYGHHLVLLLWTKNNTYNQLRHSLPLTVETTIRRDSTWVASVRIPADYLPTKVTRFNAYSQHGAVPGRHREALYPQPASDSVPDSHALQYFHPIDLDSVMKEHSDATMSQLWQDTVQGIYRYEISSQWNTVPIEHSPAVLTMEGFEAGVELNVTATFFNDPAPVTEPGQPLYGLWDYEVVEMFFLNDKDEYLEVELGPWGQHLILMLKGERNAIKHSLPLDYVVTARERASGTSPGMWQASALIPPSYFPPNVTRMNAYAIHGTGRQRVYEALYPAPRHPNFPSPDFHRLRLFQKIDFEFLVVDNSQYSDLWRAAIANMSTTRLQQAAQADDVTTIEGAESTTDLSLGNERFAANVAENDVFAIETTTDISEQISTTLPDSATDAATTDLATTDATAADGGHARRAEIFETTDTNQNEIVGSTDATGATIIDEPVTEEFRITNVRLTTTAALFDDGDVTTVIPEVTTDPRIHDVPQPELIKVARKQDIARPAGNLFRPIPVRAPPRTPHPTRLAETANLQPFIRPNVPFSNPAFGIVQRPIFTNKPHFPPPSFFNQQHSSFNRPSAFSHTPVFHTQTALINGRPVVIQGHTDFTLRPQIKLKEEIPQSHTHLLPQQPHLDHLHHHQQQEQQHNIDEDTGHDNQQLQTKFDELDQQTNEISPTGHKIPLVTHSVLTKTEPQPQPETVSQDTPATLSNAAPQEPDILPQTPHQAFSPPTISEELLPLPEQTLNEAQDTPPTVTQHVAPVQKQEVVQPLQQSNAIEPNRASHHDDTYLPAVPSAIAFSQYTPPFHHMCSKQGLRADPFRCPIFHECVIENNEWQMYTWRCPRGKYFNEKKNTCLKGYC